MSGNGFFIGDDSGKKYGLILDFNKSDKKPPPKININKTDDSDSDDDVQETLKKEAEKRQKTKKAQMVFSQALSEDPTVFDYDSVYDDIKQKQTASQTAKRDIEKKSRYIQAIIDKSQQRQLEQDLIYERKLKKEQEQDGEMFGDKDRFVTGAYKEKLIAAKKWEEEEAKRVAKEEDITRKKDMMEGNFYGNLFNNIISGGVEQQPKQKPRDVAHRSVESESRSSQKEKVDNRKDTSQADHKHDEKKIDNENDANSSSRDKESKLAHRVKVEGVQDRSDNKGEPETKKIKVENDDNTDNNNDGNTLANKDANKEANKEDEDKAKEKLFSEKRTDDKAIAAAKARYLERKAKMQQQ